MTAVPLDSAEAPPNIWEDPYCWDVDAGLDWVPAHLTPNTSIIIDKF